MGASVFSIAYGCVLIAALMPIVCAGLAKSHGIGKPVRDGGYDNSLPRQWLAGQTGWRARAHAAQSNCFEALPFFIGAIALAQQAGADATRLDALALAFVVLRVLYVALYITDRANARSLVWTLALTTNVAILFSAGSIQ